MISHGDDPLHDNYSMVKQEPSEPKPIQGLQTGDEFLRGLHDVCRGRRLKKLFGVPSKTAIFRQIKNTWSPPTALEFPRVECVFCFYYGFRLYALYSVQCYRTRLEPELVFY